MSLPRLGSLEHLSLVRLCKANAPRSGMIWKDSHSEKSKSSWIILDCVSSDGFHHHVSLFCSLPCSMIRPLPDAFFERCFRILNPAPRPTSETRETRPPRPGALSSPNWRSLGFVGVGKSWTRYLMFSQARFANSFAPLCSFCSNSLGMFVVFTFSSYRQFFVREGAK